GLLLGTLPYIPPPPGAPDDPPPGPPREDLPGPPPEDDSPTAPSAPDDPEPSGSSAPRGPQNPEPSDSPAGPSGPDELPPGDLPFSDPDLSDDPGPAGCHGGLGCGDLDSRDLAAELAKGVMRGHGIGPVWPWPEVLPFLRDGPGGLAGRA